VHDVAATRPRCVERRDDHILMVLTLRRAIFHAIIEWLTISIDLTLCLL
jgi:hypothetical protein